MVKDSNRPRRVAELIKRQIAGLIPRTLDDPRAHAITLTHAEMTRDLSLARIYFTLLANTEQALTVTKALNRVSGKLRHELMGRVELRIVPELRFYYDESVARGAHLTQLIDRAVAEDRERKENESN